MRSWDGKLEEPIETSDFILAIRLTKYSNGQTLCQFQSKNNGVPIETVIMQLKAFLNSAGKEYFDKFDKNAKPT